MIPKFRYWDKHENRMISNAEIVIWNGNAYRNDENKIRERLLDGKRGLIGWSLHPDYLMQSTGLFDKNGEEIFEGDLVKFTVFNRNMNGIYEVVKANSGEWRIDNKTQGRSLYISGSHNCEIIGNIYETPYLLEDS